MPDTNAERLITLGSAAAGIAHDINNQLMLVANYLSVQDREGAMEAVARCSALTGSLLAFARGESVRLAAVDPSDFLRKFLANLRLPEGIRLVTDVPASLPCIMADPLSLERALTNLISNACAAMENVGTLRVSAAAQQIEVGDSGPGIAEDQAARIFEPFFSTKGGQGTGLGLSIVRDIMRQHGGSVTVRSRLRSQPARGAVFKLRFRAASQGNTGLNVSPRKIAPAA